MKYISRFVEKLDEEICGAKDYAEHFVECKAKNNSQSANRYKEMALDEIKHAMYIHEMAVAEIETLKKVYTAPTDMQEMWEKSHIDYVDKVAWVKQMLTL